MDYTVYDPQGNERVIEGPEGASDAEVIAQAKKLFGESGGMAPIGGQDKLGAIREAITPLSATASAVAGMVPAPAQGLKSLITSAFPGNRTQSPQEAFRQDVNTGNAQDTTVDDLAIVQAAASAPAALRSVGGLIDGGVSKVANYLSTLKNAKGVAQGYTTADTALEAGNAISAARSAKEAGMKKAKDVLYSKVPKDLTPSLPETRDVTTAVLAEMQQLPKSFQTKRVLSLAKDMQGLETASIRNIQSMNSTLKDLAYNGEGVEKMYAARLSQALQKDLEAFSRAPASMPPSQDPTSLFADDLRSRWGKRALTEGVSPDVVAPYMKPHTFAPTVSKETLTGADAVAKLRTANSYYKDMSTLLDSPLNQSLKKAALESQSHIVFKRGHVEDIRTARALLGDEGYKAVQGQFYNKLVGAKDITKAMEKYTPEFLNAALGPQRMKSLKDVAHFYRLADRVKKAALGAVGATSAVGLYKALKS